MIPMAKAVLRFEKLKTGNLPGSSAHVARTLDTPNADPKRRHLNLTTGNPDARAAVMDRVQAVTGGKYRKDAVVAYEFVMTAKAEWFSGKSKKQVKQWANRSINWLRNRFGADNVVSSTLHLDEAAPHLHAYVVPEIDGRLSAKAYTGTRKQCSDLQTGYAKAMAPFGLERGLKGSKAVHVPPSRFHALVNAQELPEAPGRLASAKAWEEYRQTVAIMLAKAQAEAEQYSKANTILANLMETIGGNDWDRLKEALTDFDRQEKNYLNLLETHGNQGLELETLKERLSESETARQEIETVLHRHRIRDADALERTLTLAQEILSDRHQSPSSLNFLFFPFTILSPPSSSLATFHPNFTFSLLPLPFSFLLNFFLPLFTFHSLFLPHLSIFVSSLLVPRTVSSYSFLTPFSLSFFFPSSPPTRPYKPLVLHTSPTHPSCAPPLHPHRDLKPRKLNATAPPLTKPHPHCLPKKHISPIPLLLHRKPYLTLRTS